jgi:L-serine dehydratase
MTLSVFDLYSIGIGPSSSHTVGPMRAANQFADDVVARHERSVHRVRVELFGSLAATGAGHGTPGAVMLGLEGADPASVDPFAGQQRVEAIGSSRSLRLSGHVPLTFDPDTDLVLHRRTSLPAHPNGMTFAALDRSGSVLTEQTSYSVGGGFVVTANPDGSLPPPADSVDAPAVPHPFSSAADLLKQCETHGISISDLMMRNELTWRTREEIEHGLGRIWHAMRDCVDHGLAAEGVLPGGLGVVRRASGLYARLVALEREGAAADRIDWLNVFALAVNEENAAGGRVVTAPTNGAAGILPAVLHHHVRFGLGARDQDVFRFLLTGAAIGMLFKLNASISGAEMGCQGEVGSACSMAAGALCEVLGGSPAQVENAAEMGIEHNLGLTCDPVGGLVQIPCIERNAIASVKAVNAAQLALHGDGTHRVSLDQAIATMRATGQDMLSKYKETSLGGLAVNVVEC